MKSVRTSLQTIRKNSFSRQDCEIIYQIALDFKKHCEKNNLLDNNLASKKIINSLGDDFDYSLSIIDEVQDFTEIALRLFKEELMKYIIQQIICH